jgi:seryl-tRNA synthetase
MNTATQNEYQLEAEYKRWEILLSSLKNENAFLIVKLSEVLEQKEDRDFISKAEYFQNEFITKDEYIKELENDIRNELVLLGNTTDGKVPIKLLRKHEKLRNEITFLQKNFSNLCIEFNKCVQA